MRSFEGKRKKPTWAVSSRLEAWTSYHTGEWVDLVHLVYLVFFVDLVQPTKPNNGLLPLVDIFSILLGIFN
jgi:hypothetical protein